MKKKHSNKGSQRAPNLPTQNTSPILSRLMLFYNWTTIQYQKSSFLLLVAFTSNVVLCCITYLLYRPQFNQTDDTEIMLIASGKIVALQPSEYLMHINIILGLALKMCYQLFPQFHWYEVALIVTLFTSHCILLWLLLQRVRSWLILVFFTLYWLVYGAYMMLSLQYTMAGGMIGIAGMMCFLTVASNQGRKTESVLNENTIKVVCAVFCILLSWLIRWKISLLIIGCLMPSLILNFIILRNYRRLLLISFACLGILIGMTHGYNTYCYSTLQRSDVLELDELRTKFHDDRVLQRSLVGSDDITEALTQTGWTGNDLSMLIHQLFYLDIGIYNTNTFKTFLNQLSEREQIIRNTTNQYLLANIKEFDKKHQEWFWKKELQIIGYPYSLITFFVCVVWLIIFFSNRDKRLLSPLLTLFVILLATLYISKMTFMRHQMQDRVFYPLFSILWFAPLLYIYPTSSDIRKNTPEDRTSFIQLISCVICFCVLCCFLPQSFLRYASINDSVRKSRILLEQYIKPLNPSPNNLYILWGYNFFSHISPFDSLEFAERLRIFWFSWMQTLPASQEMLHHFGIRDLSIEMAMREDILHITQLEYLTNDYFIYGERYKLFLKEHYNVSCTEERRILYNDTQPINTLVEVKFRVKK